jgi:hypothetical protein
MADIQLKDLFDRNFSGSDLFEDKETFMLELSDDNEQIVGGMPPICCPVSARTCTITTNCGETYL